MQELKVYYRAFRGYCEKLSEDHGHQLLLKSLLSDRNASEGFQREASSCVWDEDWICEMLDALPYVERALAEQRKFIETHEEIRRIDQAKKTSVESVRHLAQHSNMISNVQGDDIIPDRVLIVERDDNYLIYENRFLYTLVRNMQDFLDTRCRAVAELSHAAVHSFHMKRSAAWERKNITAEIQLCFEQRSDRLQADADVSMMTDAQRVRYLQKRVLDLNSAPLMRLLRGATPVSMPVVRTNVFKKNPNFKRALELFEYLANYSKPGYEIVAASPEEEKLPEVFRRELCEAMALEHFIGRMNANEGLRAALEENFLLENDLAEQERRRLEEERERMVLQRIADARAEEIAIREREVALREEIIAEKEARLQEASSRISALSEEMHAAESRHASAIQMLKDKHAAEMSGLILEHQSEITRMKAEAAQEQRNHEEAMRDLKNEMNLNLKRRIQELSDEHERRTDELRLQSKALLQHRDENWKARIDAIRKDYEKKNAQAIARMKKECDAVISSMNNELVSCKKTVQRLEAKLERCKQTQSRGISRLLHKRPENYDQGENT